ncbi:MAG: lysine biosynthesis protein LysW [Anaerolineaceae bacterium]|nr:lysine biosynthesis protein LysW [Anaerolineaceae bacterium]
MENIICVECDAEFSVNESVEESEILVCPDCGVDLEVISVNPLTVDLAPMEEEDWGE